MPSQEEVEKKVPKLKRQRQRQRQSNIRDNTKDNAILEKCQLNQPEIPAAGFKDRKAREAGD